MSEPPRVSVVVAERDGGEDLLTTLRHMVELPERPPVVVVDNGSRDGTPAAVRRRFPGVRVLELGRNCGAVARNAGARACTTPYVAFADDDSWWAPGALGCAVHVLDAAPRHALLAARVLVGPQGRLDPVCRQMAASPLPREPADPGPPVLGFVACGAVVRRDAFLAVGGFDPVVFFFGEETLLAQDLRAAGWRLAYVEDVVAHHHPGSGPRPGRARLGTRNALLSAWMRRPPSSALSRTVALLSQRRDRATLGGLADALVRLPAAMRRRRRLPPEVEAEVRLLEAGAVS